MNLVDQDTARPFEPEPIRNIAGDFLPGRAKPWPHNFARRKSVCEDGLHKICRNGKADTERAAAFTENGGIDTGNLPVHGQERAPGVTRINRCVGLDKGLNVIAHPGITIKRGNNPAGYRLSDTERVADRNDKVANFKRIGIRKFQKRELFPLNVDFQDGEIRAFIRDDDPRIEFSTIR